ncbi:MAG: PDZ domain-containing protein [Planctomycetota bacterium]|jgi:hypothetical protein
MRFALLLLLALPLNAGDRDVLKRAARDFAHDDFDVREAATRAVKRHLQRELSPLLEAMHAKDPEVSRRAREALASFLPEGETAADVLEEVWGVRGNVIIVQGGNRIVFNNERQVDKVGQKLQQFGVQGYPVQDPLTRSQLGLAAGRGYAVTRVTKGSAAAQLGLQANDIILKVQGRAVSMPAALLAALGPQAKWLEAGVRVLRRGKPRDLERQDPRHGRPK